MKLSEGKLSVLDCSQEVDGVLRIVFSVLFLLGSARFPAYGQNQPCSDEASKEALERADALRSWDALAKHYSVHKNCDDGAVAEGYSESVVRILADHWDTLGRFAELSKTVPGFRRFVLRYIDATVEDVDLRRIRSNAASKCPAGLQATCADIVRSARLALAELKH